MNAKEVQDHQESVLEVLSCELQCHICLSFLDTEEIFEVKDNIYCKTCMTEQFVQCEGCAVYDYNHNFFSDDSCYYCDDCMTTRENCIACDQIYEKADMTKYERDYFCPHCFSEHFALCTNCDDPVHDNDARVYDDSPYCEDCFGNMFICENCSGLYSNDDANMAENNYYCDECFRDLCFTCIECDENFLNSSGYGEEFCENCRSEINPCYENSNRDETDYKKIHDHGYKPKPVFFGGSHTSDCLYLGVELEIDGGGTNLANAMTLLSILNEEKNHVYVKKDSSLSCGMELVSHPATLYYHTVNIPWEEMVQKALDMNYFSHKTETCGMHVHMSRSAFGEYLEDAEENIDKVILIVEMFWEKWVKFSRRKPNNLARWASRYGLGETARKTIDNAKKDLAKHRAVNIIPKHTIELRLFRGTLKIETFYATLQMCQHIHSVVMNNDMEKVEQMSWSDFVRMIPEDYIYLKEYLTNIGINS